MKLTKTLRAEIFDNTMKHAFENRLLALAIERQELAYKVYDTLVADPRADQLGEPWVTRKGIKFDIEVPNVRYSFSIDGALTNTFTMNRLACIFNVDDKRALHWSRDTPEITRSIVLPLVGACFKRKADPFADNYMTIAEKMTDTISEMQCVSGALRTKLDQHQTTEALLKSWPEVKQFLPTRITLAPAKSPSNLNKMLGL